MHRDKGRSPRTVLPPPFQDIPKKILSRPKAISPRPHKNHRIPRSPFASTFALSEHSHQSNIMANNAVEQPREGSTTTTITIGVTRLGQWFALGFFASIALIALVTRYDDFETERAVVKWALSVLCITVGCTALAIIASMTVPDKFSGTNVEGGLVSTCPCAESVAPLSARPITKHATKILTLLLYHFLRFCSLCWFSSFCLLVFLRLCILAINLPSTRMAVFWTATCIFSRGFPSSRR